MTDKKQKPKMTNFDDLDDRIIGEATQEPSFSIKTNLDPKDPTEENPYFNKNEHHSKEDIEKFKKYFQ